MPSELKVTVYTIPKCNYCEKVKAFLKTHNVEFSEIDVMRDKDALKKIIALGYKSVPVTMINNDVISGFEEKELSEKLGIKPDLTSK